MTIIVVKCLLLNSRSLQCIKRVPMYYYYIIDFGPILESIRPKSSKRELMLRYNKGVPLILILTDKMKGHATLRLKSTLS